MICLSLFLGTAFSQPESPLITKVIELHYIKADQLSPQLNMFLLPGEKIAISGNSLMVSVSPDTLTKLRTFIQKLDVPPVVFNVSIYQGSDDWLSNQDNNDAVYGTSSQNESGNAQSVRVLSGESAFISTGTERPVISSVSGGFWRGVSYAPKTETQGFYVLPVLQGEQVKVTLRRVRQQENQVNNQASEDQYVDTTTMVPLGKWTKLGSAGQSDTITQPDSTTYSAGGSFTNQATLYIRISTSS